MIMRYVYYSLIGALSSWANKKVIIISHANSDAFDNRFHAPELQTIVQVYSIIRNQRDKIKSHFS